jgi:glycosyltransferase involved in cell wall biosynthesis
MKITLIQDFLRSGGTERQTVLLANAFAAAGHATTLVTFRPGGPLAGTVSPQVRHRTLQPWDLRLDWFAPGLHRTVAASEADIVVCLGRMANCYAGAIQARRPGAAVLATMRTGKPLPARFVASLHTVRHVVANSADARQTLVREHAVPADKISVIYNSLVFPAAAKTPPARTGQAARDVLLREFGAAPTTTVLLCVAMFRPEKNQRELIEIVDALDRAREWQLWLAGEGPARAACEALVTEKKLGTRVKFFGFQRNPSRLYEAADFAVHASWSEALSNFLIEAQAHGLPAVAYEAQGIAECFVPGRTGWVIPRDDRAAFRDTLQRLMAQPTAERLAAAAGARAFARETFDPARQVAAYLQLFHQLRGGAESTSS